MNNNTIDDVINADYLFPRTNFSGSHNIRTRITDKVRGIMMSVIGTS